MKEFKENLYYAKLQINNALNSETLIELENSPVDVHDIKHLLLSAIFMLRLVEDRIKGVQL